MIHSQLVIADHHLIFECQAASGKSLAEMSPGEEARIHGVGLESHLGQRLLALGFLPGQTVRFLKRAPFQDPILVEIGSRTISLRLQEAARVYIGTV